MVSKQGTKPRANFERALTLSNQAGLVCLGGGGCVTSLEVAFDLLGDSNLQLENLKVLC